MEHLIPGSFALLISQPENKVWFAYMCREKNPMGVRPTQFTDMFV